MGTQPSNHYGAPVSSGESPADIACVLTNREIEVLRLMGEGLTTKAIAPKLNITFKTAACHRFHVLQKLGADSTVSAVRWAIKQGIVTL